MSFVKVFLVCLLQRQPTNLEVSLKFKMQAGLVLWQSGSEHQFEIHLLYFCLLSTQVQQKMAQMLGFPATPVGQLCWLPDSYLDLSHSLQLFEE